MRDRGLVVAAAALAYAAIGPWRDFPVLDDWSYAYTVKTVRDSGIVRLSDWSSPTFVLQGLWGLLFCAEGFSHAALRLSTLALAVGCVLLAHRWFRAVGLAREAAALATAALAFNPVFVNLAFSYMTDVPFLFLVLVFLNLAASGEPSIAACGAAAALASLVRQPGALLAVGYAVYLARRRKLTWTGAALLLGPSVAALGAFEAWLRLVHGETWARYWYNARGTAAHLHPTPFALDALARSGWLALYGGLAAIPFSLGARFPIADWRRLSPKRRIAAAALLAAALALALFAFPSRDATLSTTGLGRWQAIGRAFKAAGPLGSAWFWKALGLAGVWSAARALPRALRPSRALIPALYATAPLALWLFAGLEFYDRYLLMLLPVALALSAAGAGPARWRWGLVLAMALLSIAGERDFLNAHEAFWRASHALEERGLPPETIWSTSEFVLWHGYQRDMDRLKREKGLEAIADGEWLDAARLRRRAVISFEGAPPPDGYARAGSFTYFSPLTLRRESLVVAVRED